MSMKQFQQRYTSKDSRLHVWSELLKRPEMEKVEWALDNPEKCLKLLRKMLDTLSIKILILDNLTFLVNNGGMKPEDVKLICSKLCEWAKEGYSILVINHTPKIPPFTPLDLNHCLGSSMLTNFVQSVFAIGTSSKNPSSERYVKQLKMIGYENQMSGTLRQGGRICQEHWRHNFSEMYRTPQTMGDKFQWEI